MYHAEEVVALDFSVMVDPDDEKVEGKEEASGGIAGDGWEWSEGWTGNVKSIIEIESDNSDGEVEPVGDISTPVRAPPPALEESFVVGDAVFASPAAFVLSPSVAFETLSSTPHAFAVGSPLMARLSVEVADYTAPGDTSHLASTVCAEHDSDIVQVHCCSCFLDVAEKIAYTELAATVRSAFNRGDSMDALEAVLAALEVCDEDLDLHAMAFSLGTALNVM
jgi:hypothetical protein